MKKLLAVLMFTSALIGGALSSTQVFARTRPQAVDEVLMNDRVDARLRVMLTELLRTERLHASAETASR